MRNGEGCCLRNPTVGSIKRIIFALQVITPVCWVSLEFLNSRACFQLAVLTVY